MTPEQAMNYCEFTIEKANKIFGITLPLVDIDVYYLGEIESEMAGSFVESDDVCTINLNSMYFEEDCFVQSIIHEVAHFVEWFDYKSKGIKNTTHGKVWKDIVRALGGVPNPNQKYLNSNYFEKKKRRKSCMIGACDCRIHHVPVKEYYDKSSWVCDFCNETIHFTGDTEYV